MKAISQLLFFLNLENGSWFCESFLLLNWRLDNNQGQVVKNPPANAGDVGSIPRLGRSPGVGNDNPLQYSCLGIPGQRSLRAAVHRVAMSWTGLVAKQACTARV